MKQDEWTRQLHDRLANHQIDAPEGLWADIEANLPEQPHQKRARLVAWRKWVVAASLLAMVSGVGVWWLSQSDGGSVEMQSASTETVDSLINNPAGSDDLLTRSVHSEIQPIAKRKTGKAVRETKRKNEKIVSPVEHDITISDEKGENTLTDTHHNVQPAADEEQPESQPENTDKKTSTGQLVERQIAGLSTRHRRQASVSLYVNNGFNSQTNYNRVVMTNELAMSYNQGAKPLLMAPVYLADYSEREKHHYPVSFGLQVSYPINRRLTLSTGVVYTKLHSDFDYLTYGQLTRREQRLDYFGVPLSLDWNLWTHKRLNIYMGAVVQADWNTSARVETESVRQHADKDRMQWSAGGQLGIQYNIIPQLSIYAEPGIRHYFDNGSNTNNYFKDKPTNVSLQLGLRLNLTTRKFFIND